jgi:hypothetical protein
MHKGNDHRRYGSVRDHLSGAPFESTKRLAVRYLFGKLVRVHRNFRFGPRDPNIGKGEQIADGPSAAEIDVLPHSTLRENMAPVPSCKVSREIEQQSLIYSSSTLDRQYFARTEIGVDQ